MNRPQQNYGSMASTAEVAFSGGAPPPEFNGLCDSIVTNIYTINSSWKTLEGALKSIGTGRDNQGLRNKIHVTQLSTNQIVAVTSKDINRLKRIVRRANKQQELQVAKLEENFKEAIARYSALQKQVADKMKANLLTIASIETESSPFDEQGQQQQQLFREIAFEQELLLEREARVQQIEADILDVNQIMRELGALVNQQSESIDTIENAIDRTAGNVEEGTEQLLKASQYQNRSRRKLLYLILIAVIVVVILVAILIWQIKH